MQKKPRAATSTVCDTRTRNNKPIFKLGLEDKGFSPIEDEYSKYDPEANASQYLINSGATIIDSRIEITDSYGRHRTLVRKQI